MNLRIRITESQVSLYLVVLGMWILFLHELLKSFAINIMFVAYSGYFILFIALVIELKNRTLSFLDKKYRLWILSIWIFSFLALIYGFVKSYELRFISRDIWPYCYFACFLIAARTKRWNIIDKMVYQQFIIGILVFVYIWVTLDITFNRETIIRNTFSSDRPHIAWACGLLFGWQYMFLRFNSDDSTIRKITTILGITIYTVFGIIMLKRQVIVEMCMIIVLKYIYTIKESKANLIKWSTVFVAAAFITFSIVKYYEKRENVSYFEEILLRSTQTGSLLDTTTKDDRLYNTPLRIYENASILEVIYGQGLGSAVVRSGGEKDTSVESGLFNIFMKGGIILLIIWYYGFLNILKDTFLRKKKGDILFGFLSAMVIIGSPVFPFFISFPSSGYQMFWLGQSASRSRESEV